MPIPLDAPTVLDREFLTIRAKMIEIAAALDRLDRAEGAVRTDPRLMQIHQGLSLLTDPEAERAERIQMVFSLPYDENWRSSFDLKPADDG